MNFLNKHLVLPVVVISTMIVIYGAYNLLFVEHSANVDNIIGGKTFEAVSVLSKNNVNFENTKASLENTFMYLQNQTVQINQVPVKGRYNPFTSAQ